MSASYTISADRKAITCHTCGMTSYSPEDIAALYCGHCHRFHEATPHDILQAVAPGSTTFKPAVMCPRCGNHFADGLTDLSGKYTALQPDSYTICGCCLAILKFGQDLKPQMQTPEDVNKLPADERATIKHLWAATFAMRMLGMGKPKEPEPKGPLQ